MGAEMITMLLGNRFLITILLCSLVSAFATYKIFEWKHGKQLAEIENATWQMKVDNLNTKNAIDLYNNRVTIEQEKNYILSQKKQKVVTQYINKEVIKYVQADTTGMCDMPAEWVRLHDIAARNNIAGDADSTAVTNDSAARITDIDALEVVTENYLTCNEVREQLMNLQEWVKKIKEK